eukprot:Awhi_evm1s7648
MVQNKKNTTSASNDYNMQDSEWKSKSKTTSVTKPLQICPVIYAFDVIPLLNWKWFMPQSFHKKCRREFEGTLTTLYLNKYSTKKPTLNLSSSPFRYVSEQ